MLACSLAAASAAAAQPQSNTWGRPKPKPPETEHASRHPFGIIPKGPVQIIISVDQQMLHLYSDGSHVTDTRVATGVPDHPTPIGVFTVIQKSILHHSNIYSGAPMPFMQRITWSGVAIHEGVNLGHPASHGCIRMSHDFATRLWVLTRLGARVIIARPELRPEDFADPHLFVHKELTAAPPSAAPADPPVPARALKTAQTADDRKATDAPGQTKDEAKGAADAPAKRNAADPAAAATIDSPAEPTKAVKQVAPAVAEVPNPVAPSGNDRADAAAVMAPEPAPKPWPKPIEIAHASKAPISIFVSRKEKKIYVRQDFLPLFDAPIGIESPDIPLGTHVFMALEYSDDHSSFRWNVVSLPSEPLPTQRNADKGKKTATGARKEDPAAKPLAALSPPPQTPQQALARIEIPRGAIDRISQLIVPGSSLIISDYGVGEETGEGTDFIVVVPGENRIAANNNRRPAPASRRQRTPAYWPEMRWR
jgi:L,D-transpeptidase catalytic domain